MAKRFAFLALCLILLCGCGASSGEVNSKELQVTSSLSGTAGSSFGSSAASEEEPAEAQEIQSQAQYFLFRRQENQIYDESGETELVYERYCDTVYSSPDATAGEWVDSVLSEIRRDYDANSRNLEEFAREVIEFDPDMSFYSYSNYQELGISRHDTRVVSLISLSSLYSGGAHPGSIQTAYNLDIENLRLLTLEDLIYEDRAQDLEQMVLAAILEKFEPYGLFEGYESTVAASMEYGNMTAYWYLNDVGLAVFYNQYELAPYAAGIIKVELPYEELEGIVREEYFLAEPDGLPGDLVLRGDWDGYQKITITIDDNGARLLVGAEGEICQIQMSEIFWQEDQPVLQNMLFSADSLGQLDVLEIIGGFDDPERSFAIEFTDGNGETTVYYVHSGGLSEEP